MEHLDINWLAAVVSAVVAWGIGSVWYGPVFGKKWMAAVGMTEEDVQGANMAKTYGTSFVLILIQIVGLAIVLGTLPAGTLSAYQGAVHGLLIGALFIATSMGINYLYEMKPMSLWLINSGYQLLYLAVGGAIMGVWQ